MGPPRRLTSPVEVPYVSCKVEHLSVSLASSSFLAVAIAFGSEVWGSLTSSSSQRS